MTSSNTHHDTSRPIVGIDLGTTFSAIGIMSPSGARLIPNSLGQVLTPSAVAVDRDGQLLVGAAAKELEAIEPSRCASVFKRYMGTDWSCELAGQTFHAVQLSALVLGGLKEDAEAFLGEPVERAVVTVPAYFNELQRRATIEAGKLAGLQVLRILNEPTAAAIAYGIHELDQEWLAAVVDLGGGTFDISIVELFERTVEVRASAGACFLGGEDFTRSLSARILESLGIVYERAEMTTPRLIARARQQCEQLKRRLTTEESVVFRLPDDDGSLPENGRTVTVTRAEFDGWTRYLLDEIRRPIRRAMGDAGITRHQLNHVVLVGGATRMPSVRDLVRELFDREPRCELNPDEVVALGAAIQAGRLARDAAVEDLVVTDVAPFTLGVEVVKHFGAEHRPGYFLPIIHRNTTIPTSNVHQVATVSPNQDSIRIVIYQGEHRLTKDNLKLDEFELTGIPRGPAGQQIDIRFTYDLNGVLEVEATVVATGKAASLVISRYADQLTRKDLDQAVAKLQELKKHPRDDAPNRLLLKRAERLYAELSIFERQELDDLLTGFEQALEMKDPEVIERHRSVLSEFLDRHDRNG